MSKKCPKCGNVDCTIPKMEHHGEQWLSCLICGQTSRESRFNDVTIFDRITASPEVLAEKLVYCGVYYKSTIIPGEYWEYEQEAVAATVEKLKEVYNG